MPYMNKAIIVGHTGKDPKVTTAKSGTTICNFTVATNDGWGENKKTNWHNVVCFGKTAQYAGDNLTKGKLVVVEGNIDYSSYEKDGKTVYVTKIIASNVSCKKEDTPKQASQEEDDVPF